MGTGVYVWWGGYATVSLDLRVPCRLMMMSFPLMVAVCVCVYWRVIEVNVLISSDLISLSLRALIELNG